MVVGARQHSGFTLVELLIVMGILAITMSLVGPLTLNQLESAQRSQERELFNQRLSYWRFYAYNSGLSLDIRLRGSQVAVYRSEQRHTQAALLAEYEFELLSFPEQQLGLNNHGFWRETEVVWMENEQRRNMPLINRGVIDAQ